jgi:hypothetical protein
LNNFPKKKQKDEQSKFVLLRKGKQKKTRKQDCEEKQIPSFL